MIGQKIFLFLVLQCSCAFAFANAIDFHCLLDKDPTSGVSVRVNAGEFNNPEKYPEISGELAILKNRKYVKMYSSAILSNDRNLAFNSRDSRPAWVIRNILLDDIGEASMGYDSSKRIWYLNIKTDLYSLSGESKCVFIYKENNSRGIKEKLIDSL